MSGTAQKRIVTIGGGTGHYSLLSGLKHHPFSVTAIVSMADDGGSSGVLRDEMGVLPPGDVRQCLAALSEDEGALRQLFSFRFSEGALRGHSFGNLFLSALQKVTGSFSAAVSAASAVLQVKGAVLPVTEGDMRLVVELKDGTKLSGEKFLDSEEVVRTVGVRRVALLNPVPAHPAALDAIREADVIILGPGDLFGSTVPPLLVPQVAQAVCASKALVLYVANLTNKRGQTDGFTAHDYAHVIHEYLGAHRIDALICNSEDPPAHLREHYEVKEGKGMFVACGKDVPQSYKTFSEAVLSHQSPMLHPRDVLANQGSRSLIRHDPARLAEAIVRVIAAMGR